MSLKEEIKNWQDKDNLVTPSYRPTGHGVSGNGILYTSIYNILLVLGGQSRERDYLDYYQVMRACQATQGSYVIKGLFNRAPKKQDQNGPDDYIGLCASSMFMNAPFAKEIYVFGKTMDWTFNNEKPDEFSWSAYFGRMPQFRAHTFYCVKKKPKIFDALVWFCSILNTALFCTDSTGWILSWLMVISAKEQSFLTELSAGIWKWGLKRSRFGRMKEVFAEHLGESHAITQCCWF